MSREISEFLKMNDVEYKENLKISSISPIHIGEYADFVIFPDSEEKLIELVRFFNKNKLNHKIVGRMSNVLFCKNKYDILIRTDRINQYKIDGRTLVVGCGASIPFISRALIYAELSGFERLSGIPGSVCGALMTNAGAFGTEISDLLYEVKIYDVTSDSFCILEKNNINFGYRVSGLKKMNSVIISAKFTLTESNRAYIKENIERYAAIRRNNQPIAELSLGSVFKRPCSDVSAARLIDECQLKGYRIGGAEISKKHAGFIVNVGGASADDYICLADFASETVYKRFGIKLVREVEYY